jgi:SRSO17 transposase
MAPAGAQRQKEWFRDCVVSPDVCHHRVDRLGDFVVPYQGALETEASPRHVPLDRAGLLAPLPRKNAETLAALVEVEPLVMQEFIGPASGAHRPLGHVLVGQGVARLGEPDGGIPFDPSSFPKRDPHSVSVKRHWCGHRGKVAHCQVGGYRGYGACPDHA